MIVDRCCGSQLVRVGSGKEKRPLQAPKIKIPYLSMPIIPNQEYDLNESAVLVGVPASSLRRSINAGEIPARRVPWGKRDKWMVRGDTLMAFSQKGVKKTPLAPAIKEWEAAIASGTLTGRPLSPHSLRALRYGLDKLISLGSLTSPQEINSRGLATALGGVPVDHKGKNCHYAIRDLIYNSCLSFARYLNQVGILPQSEIDAMRRLIPRRVYPARKTVATAAQVDSLMDAAFKNLSSPEDVAAMRLLILLLAVCGLRIGEAIAIKMKDLDQERGFFWVRSGKGGKDRRVPYPREVGEALSAWLRVRPKESPHALLPISRVSANRRIKKWGADMGMDITPHGLRRSAATIWHNDKGMSLDRVRRLLGHSNLATTQGYLMAGEDDLLDYIRGVDTPEESKPPVMAGILD